MADTGVISCLSPVNYVPNALTYTWVPTNRPVDNSADNIMNLAGTFVIDGATYTVQPKDRGTGSYSDLVSSSSSSSSGSGSSGSSVKQYWG